nr:hypothetical protein LOC100333420 [Haemonchus contortus]
MNYELFIKATTLSQLSETTNDLTSAGREELNVGDDLSTDLDPLQSSSSLHNITDGAVFLEPPQVSPSLITVRSSVPEHIFSDGGVRSVISPAPMLSMDIHRRCSIVSSCENVTHQESLYQTESHKKSVQDETVVKLGVDIPGKVLSSTVPTTHAALLMSMPELAISKWSHPHVQSGKPLKTFIRSNSLKSKFVSPKPSLPSSLSLPGVQKWKTEPPLHFSAPASDKEVPRDRNVCSSYKPFPAEQNARPTYFSPPSPAEKKAPPEPPVDYHDHLNSEENAPPAANASKGTFPFASQNVQDGVKLSTPEELCKTTFAVRKHPHRQTVTKKTRTYTVNGMQVTSTTMHVLGAKEDMQLRKQQLQDLRRLQREEARQRQELQVEGVSSVEQQERKFQQERAILTRQYEIDMETLERRQKREIEEAEKVQEDELKQAQKRIKYEQEKDLRAFKERLKKEMKIMRQELDMLPRHQRKDALRMKKDQLEYENHAKEADFFVQLQKNAESTLARLTQKHKKMATLERQFLLQKHLLLRAKENSNWELEEKQMGEKYALHRKLFKDEYFLLRTQMLARHQKELAQVQKFNQEEEAELVRALALDRKKLPKMLRNEAKTRSHMFKESLRISMQAMTPAEMSEKMRGFDEQENMRIRKALEEHDLKSAKKIAQLKERHQSAMSELDEMQNEKRKQLLEKERMTMQEHEKKYYSMREQWQADLAPRKLVLESRFQDEMETQERFYGISLSGAIASTPLLPGSIR